MYSITFEVFSRDYWVILIMILMVILSLIIWPLQPWFMIYYMFILTIITGTTIILILM